MSLPSFKIDHLNAWEDRQNSKGSCITLNAFYLQRKTFQSIHELCNGYVFSGLKSMLKDRFFRILRRQFHESLLEISRNRYLWDSCRITLLLYLSKELHFSVDRPLKPGFQIVVPVVTIVSVASNFLKRQGRSYGNALAITRDDPGTILATETISCPR